MEVCVQVELHKAENKHRFDPQAAIVYKVPEVGVQVPEVEEEEIQRNELLEEAAESELLVGLEVEGLVEVLKKAVDFVQIGLGVLRLGAPAEPVLSHLVPLPEDQLQVLVAALQIQQRLLDLLLSLMEVAGLAQVH